MHGWSIQATRELILRQTGKSQLQLANPSLRSVIERQDYARFHYYEIKDRLDDFLRSELKDRELIEVAFSSDDDVRANHQQFHVAIGAHVLGCIQSLHAVADIAAHATYYSLGLNLSIKPLKEAAIDFRSVLTLLQNDPILANVARLFAKLIDSEFNHIAALTNYGKHRSVVAPGLHEDQTGLASQKHWLQFPAFRYKDAPFQQVEALPLLQREIDRMNHLIVELGKEIHAVLVAREA